MTEKEGRKPSPRDLALRACVRKGIVQGMTIERIAEEAGCSSNDILDILEHAKRPSPEVVGGILVALGLKKAAADRFEVFVAWGTRSDDARIALQGIRKKQPEDTYVNIPCLDPAEGLIFDGIVRTGIERAHRFIGLLERPNANVTFELGYAAGRGLSCAVAHMGAVRPDWLGRAPFSSLVSKAFENSRDLVPALTWSPLSDDHKNLEWECHSGSSGAATLVLCPERGVGYDLADGLRALVRESDVPGSDWRFHCEGDWSLDGVGNLLEGVGRVLWIITRHDGTEDEDDGEPNARLAFLAGLALAGGRSLTVWRQQSARVVADVEHLLPGLFRSQDEFPQLLRKLPPIPGEPPTVQEIRVLDLWRQHVRDFHCVVGERTAHDMNMVVPIDVQARMERKKTGSGSEEPSKEDWLQTRGEQTLDGLLTDLGKRKTKAPGIILIGQPGAGKTTTMRHLAWTAVEERREVPVLYLHAARLAEKTAAAALAEDIEGEPAQVTREFLDLAPNAARPVWILIDGWDEIGPGQGRKAQAQIRKLAKIPHVLVVIASRPVGEPERTFSDFEPYELRPLTRERQLQFLATVLGRDRAARLHADASRHRAIAELMESPLVLDLLAELHLADRPVPRRRSELYREAIDWHLDRPRQKARDGTAPCPKHWAPIEAKILLSRIALILHADKAGQESYSLDDVAKALRRALEEEPGLRSNLAPWVNGMSGFLDDLGRLSGILGPTGGPRQPWGFLHRSFREFLVATALAERGPEAWRDLLAKQKDEDVESKEGRERRTHWSETLVFLAGIVDDEHQEEVLRTLLGIHSDLAARSLLQVTGLSPSLGLEIYFGMAVAYQEGDLLAELLRAWEDEGHQDEELVGLLMDHAKSERDSTDTEEDPLRRQAVALRARERWRGPLEASALDAFFEAVGRPRRTRLLVDAIPTRKEASWEQVAPRDLADEEILLARIPPEGAPHDFEMGSAEPSGDDDERPRHPVRISPFRLGLRPVTRAQYRQFDPDHECPGGDDHPVTEVDWWRAWLYCRWLALRANMR